MSDQPYLTVEDHNRDVSGMLYVYPVVSRRAGGVSIGINLNVNNACNWRCVYCQVPDLKRGSPPPIDIPLLEQELRHFLDYALHGDFMTRYVAEGDRQLQDIAFSGNGEPTSAKEFPDVLVMLERVLNDFNLLDKAQAHPIPANPIKVRLISNGSLMDKDSVLASLKHLASLNDSGWVDWLFAAAVFAPKLRQPLGCGQLQCRPSLVWHRQSATSEYAPAQADRRWS